MKKLFITMLLATSVLFALPQGNYICVISKIIFPDNTVVKLTEKQMVKNAISLTLGDGYLVDKVGEKYKYMFSKKDIDIYQNKNKNLYIGLNENLDANNMTKFGITLSSKKTLVGMCKFEGK